MTKYIQEALFELVSNFAQYNNEGEDVDEPYWWGHDTNLGTQEDAFRKAEKQILAQRRPYREWFMKKTTMSALFSKSRRGTIAKAIFGKDIPIWWKGSRGEYDLLSTIANYRGFKL